MNFARSSSISPSAPALNNLLVRLSNRSDRQTRDAEGAVAITRTGARLRKARENSQQPLCRPIDEDGDASRPQRLVNSRDHRDQSRSTTTMSLNRMQRPSPLPASRCGLLDNQSTLLIHGQARLPCLLSTEGCQSTLPASGPPMIAIRSASGASVRLLKPR